MKVYSSAVALFMENMFYEKHFSNYDKFIGANINTTHRNTYE
jgi:hypothetical protein